MSTIKKTVEFIEAYNMLSDGDTVLAAVSGGADSVCMLYHLVELTKNFNIILHAAHFNHMLRGSESDRDEDFVRNLCQKLGIQLFCGQGDVSRYATEHSLGTEEAARILRYEFLQKTASELNAAKIATAHNADDNAETVILNLTRGSGLAGMRGIPPVRDNIIRPILCLTRDSVENYLKERGIEYVTDSSNYDDKYSRNNLRHNVMPVLKTLNPRFSENLLKSCDIIRHDEAYLSEEADRILAQNANINRISISLLLNLPISLSSRIIRKLGGTGLTAASVNDVLALCKNPLPSAKLNLPGITVQREYDDIVFGDISDDAFKPIFLKEGESVLIPELNLEVTLEKAAFIDNIHKSFTDYIFKSTDVYGKITIRPKETGDSIKLRSTGCTKTLKKLFVEKHIPAAKRKQIPVIADDHGVLGVYKIGCDIRGEPALGDTIYNIHFKELPIL